MIRGSDLLSVAVRSVVAFAGRRSPVTMTVLVVASGGLVTATAVVVVIGVAAMAAP